MPEKDMQRESPKKRPPKETAAMLLKIFVITFKLGAFTFGGGYAMIPLMQREFVDKAGWIKDDDILDLFAVAQSLPGVIAANASVMIGYRIAGIWGAVSAVLGVTLPSLITLCVITLIYQSVIENEWVQAAMRGVRAGVVALIASAVIRMAKDGLKDIWQWLLAAAALLIAIFTSVSAVWLIIGGAVIGWAISLLRRRKGEGLS